MIFRQRMRQACPQGFTLIELLVVVAIIAVIGAGVAVTYQRLDDQAKTSMEMSDISILKKVTKHWSAVNNFQLPDGLDSLVDDEGNLYTSFRNPGTQTNASSSGRGLLGPIGYATLEVAPAPPIVLQNLAAAGMNFTYLHRVAATNANDSTFVPTGGFGVDTATTRATLVVNDTQARANASEVVADTLGVAHDYTSGPYSLTTSAGATFTAVDAAAWSSIQAQQQGVLDAITTDRLVFVYPGGGVPFGPNYTQDIITNAGLRPEQVANPRVAPTGEQKYYLVVMGFGRFASIYQGKAVRADAPSFGKRLAQSENDYNRYLAVIRVPVTPWGNPSQPANEPPVLADVLSPQGLSVAALRRFYINDQRKIQDDNT